ncbi:FAD6 [Auxenochlorella protothecoides x Auxenochlorella symbiontica]
MSAVVSTRAWQALPARPTQAFQRRIHAARVCAPGVTRASAIPARGPTTPQAAATLAPMQEPPAAAPATPQPAGLSDEERAALAQKLGYRTIGKDLPEDVTLVQVIKSMPPEVFEINPWRAWSAVGITLVSAAVSLYLISISPWYLLPFAWALAGTAFTGFFVIGHDAGHRAFSKNRLLEDIVGTLMFAPLIYPFEPWRIKHNHHHAHTNKLVEDTAWHPIMPELAATWTSSKRAFWKLALGSPVKCWASIGHWLLWHFDASKFTAKQMPRVLVSWAAVAAFAGLALPALVATTGWAGLVKYWLMPWLGYHFWMSTFTLVHHTAQHIPFKPAESWNAAQAQLAGTVHCDYPWLVEFLCHDISVHVPHHVNSKIPWYNLRAANESLRANWGQYMTEARFNWRMMKNIFTELHEYDEANNYRPFDAKAERPDAFLEAQRKLLPDSM